MTKLSVLDLASITEGSDAGTALRNARTLAQAAERLGYHRFWMAEHHSMPGIASAATAVALGFVAEGTRRIRIGAGGIMLPNHSPLQVAEQFGTLAALYPGRIDLGLGRAPGTDQAAAYAMRRTMSGDVSQFPRDVMELLHYLEPAADPPARVRAIPGEGTRVPVWILGSSLYGAQLAAHLGLPYAFASHFAPDMLDEALHIYRRDFQPSLWLAEPYVMLGFNVIAADSDDEGQLLATSLAQAFIALRSGNPGKLPPPDPAFLGRLPAAWRATPDGRAGNAAIGAPATVKAATEAFLARTGADELMISGQIFDAPTRLRSYEILADLMLGASPPASSAAATLAEAH